MYIKATKTHTDKDGQPVRSHRLVLSRRVGDKVRHRALLNLGTDYPVPREKWKVVTDLAEALLLGRPPLLEAAPDVQAAAEDIVAKLRARGFRPEAIQEEARKPEIATVDLDTLEHENPRTVGCERLCLKALDDLGFAEILHGLDIKGRDGRIATALIVARMVHPASERDTSRWLRRDSATAELLELEGDRKALRRKQENLLRFVAGMIDDGPEWLAAFDPETLEPVPTERIDETLHRHLSDLVWRVRLRDSGEEDWAYLFVLIEFQSAVDHLMALRVEHLRQSSVLGVVVGAPLRGSGPSAAGAPCGALQRGVALDGGVERRGAGCTGAAPRRACGSCSGVCGLGLRDA